VNFEKVVVDYGDYTTTSTLVVG